MEIDRAKYLAQEHAAKTMNSTYVQAIDILIKYVTDLEKKVNNKEKVITIDQEELILRITALHKRLNSERNYKERELTKTGLPSSKKLIKKELDEIDIKQKVYVEIINLIKEL